MGPKGFVEDSSAPWLVPAGTDNGISHLLEEKYSILKKDDYKIQKLIIHSLERVCHLFNKHFPIVRKLFSMPAKLGCRLSKNDLALCKGKKNPFSWIFRLDQIPSWCYPQ